MMANVNSNNSTREEETALDWFQRCQQRKSVEKIPTDPISASRVFVSGKTGLSPIDMAWKLLPSQHYSTSSSSLSHRHPAILVLDGTIAKTTMILSLAARFVVQTRPSQFYHHDESNNNEKYNHLHTHSSATYNNTADTTTTHKYPPQHQSLPQVIILDSTLDITPRKLLNIVKTTLLRQPSPQQPKGPVNNNNNNNIHNNRDDEEEQEQILENDLKECLSRIHISHVDDDGLGWLPVLEAIRYQIKQRQQMGTATATFTNTNTWSATNNKKKHHHHQHPTYLILWDGYNEYHNQTSEITKQISRLCEECSVAIVFATTTAITTSSSSTATMNIPNIPTTTNTNNINNNKMMKFDWVPSSRSVHRIHLYQRGGSGGGKDCYAVVNGGCNNKRSFSISAGGILS